MLNSLKPYLWIVEVVLAIGIGIICAVGGWKVANKDTVLVQSKLDTANGLIAQRDLTIAAFEKSTREAQNEEDAAKAREKQASTELAHFIVSQAKRDKMFSKHTSVIITRPECAALKERLCPAAMGY